VPEDIDCHNVHFEAGDAHCLRENLGAFDVVLAANLIDRLADPGRLIQRLPSLVKLHGQLIITSPYTWMEEFTPHGRWLGGREVEGEKVSTYDALKVLLAQHFKLRRTLDLPFLIREHARKFQWSVAQATVWQRI
jgi:2-polyprenyl-3-methyl-5-hydroxy-6-metoxy-1,4-benzoquinol methylase